MKQILKQTLKQTLLNLRHDLSRSVLLSLFRADCPGCGNHLVQRSESIICSDCRDQLELDQTPACPLCGRLLSHWYEKCGECLIRLPYFQKHQSYGRYGGVLKDLILAYKYAGKEQLKHIFAPLLVQTFQYHTADQAPHHYLVPVPPDNKRDRDFDPVLETARLTARQLNIPLAAGNLIKIKSTEPQAGLSRARRLRNLDGAFALKNPQTLAGKTILLIDDIFTTGTTIAQCAKLLTRQQAKVTAITLARS